MIKLLYAINTQIQITTGRQQLAGVLYRCIKTSTQAILFFNSCQYKTVLGLHYCLFKLSTCRITYNHPFFLPLSPNQSADKKFGQTTICQCLQTEDNSKQILFSRAKNPSKPEAAKLKVLHMVDPWAISEPPAQLPKESASRPDVIFGKLHNTAWNGSPLMANHVQLARISSYLHWFRLGFVQNKGNHIFFPLHACIVNSQGFWLTLLKGRWWGRKLQEKKC